MKLRKAIEVKKEQMYTDKRLAIEISEASNEKKTKTNVNLDLVTKEQIDKLRELGYNLYQGKGSLEISWQYV